MLNVRKPPIFIEVGMLKNKLNEIRYELECVLISKIPKKIGFISIKGYPGRARLLG